MQRVAVSSFPFCRQNLQFGIHHRQGIWADDTSDLARQKTKHLDRAIKRRAFTIATDQHVDQSLPGEEQQERVCLPAVHPFLDKRAFKKAVTKLGMHDHLEMQDVSATLMFQEVQEGLHWAETERFVVRWKDVWSGSSEMDTFCFIFFPVLILTECVHG